MYNLSKLGNIWKKYNNYILLSILLIIVSIITYYKIIIQMNLGPRWDTYDFLVNALFFADKNIGYSDLDRPPFLSFLTSIFFRMGYISELTIFIIDGLLFIFGVIGLYLLLKIRLSSIMGFLGSLLFATFPIIIKWVGVGYTDIASVSFSIWTIYFTILAVKRNSKYFYLVFPLLMITFLTRYPTALILFPIGLYLLINKKILNNLKDMIIGILISIIPLVPVLTFFYLKFGDPLYPFFYFINVTQQNISLEHFAYHPEIFYYLNHLTDYIGLVGITLILSIILISISYGFTNLNKIKSNIRHSTYFKIDAPFKKIKVATFIISVIIFLGTFGKILFIISEIIFFLICYISYGLLKNLNKNIDINMLFLLWFMVFFILNSVLPIKTDRYFIQMTPALIYFIIMGLNIISTRIGAKIKNINLTSTFLSIILIFIILMSGANSFNCLPTIDYHTEDTVTLSNWFKNYDPTYKNEIIYADFYWPHFSWYLKTDIKPMPIFKNDKAYYYELENYYPNSHDNINYNNELEKNKADYYFCVRPGLNLTSYIPIKQFGLIILYKRVKN